MKTLSLARTIVAAGILTIAATVAPAGAEAQEITACYTKKSGTMYRVGAPNTPADCTAGTHVKEVWSTEGNGFTHFVMMGDGVQIPAGEEVEFSVDCPENYVAIGGGHHLYSYDIQVKISRPGTKVLGVLIPTRWTVVARNVGAETAQLSIIVSCGQMTKIPTD